MFGREGGIAGEKRPLRRVALVATVIAAVLTLGVVVRVATGGASPVAAATAPVEARDLHVDGDARRTRISLDLDRDVPLQVFTIAEPPRLVVDLPETRFAFAADRGGGRGLVASARWGAEAGARARIVFDLSDPAEIAAATLGEDGLGRLVVVLDRSTVPAMRAARPLRLGGGPETTATIAAAKGDRDRPAALAATPHAPQPNRPVVVIDPGHGGVDVGTRSPATGTFEKTVVLDMAAEIERALEATGRYEVHATRTEDVYVPLGRRVAIAREMKADLLISIHADAEYDHSVRGATIYTVSERPSDAKAAALAAKENAADALSGHVAADERDEVGDILADLTIRETRRFSLIAARDILEEYRRHGRLVKGEAHRQAGLKVLRAHDVPSVLMEIGFLSNKEDEKLMTSPQWREKIAGSLVTAVDRFFHERGVPGMARAGEAGAAASP
ncbi:MAG: N-acetylmuramoyl-L-alanine amidase [Phyllobacteriaceae bacterium]|nr:N-acetylmuramoyl-L-alanine amidase [Phyllobacteriaceae bacterium]